MAFTLEEATTTILGMDKELTSLRKQNNRLHFIAAALLRALPPATAAQALRDLQHVEPGTSPDALEAQESAAVFVEQLLSFSGKPDGNQPLQVIQGGKTAS